jgi:hypothetical protein
MRERSVKGVRGGERPKEREVGAAAAATPVAENNTS